ncbi:MAG: DUF1501 domain-containing protein [Gemmataceae bacterium]
MSDKLAIDSSMRHDQGNHGAGNHYLMTGGSAAIRSVAGAFVSYHPSMGSVVAHERPAPNGLPAYFSIPEMSRSGGPNFLGAKNAPFVVQDNRIRPASASAMWPCLPGSPVGRFGTRQEIRREVDRLADAADPAAGDPAASLDDNYRQGTI